jgi:hypothetical protein
MAQGKTQQQTREGGGVWILASLLQEGTWPFFDHWIKMIQGLDVFNFYF